MQALLVHWSPKVSSRFLGLHMCISIVNQVHVEKENEQILKLRKSAFEDVRNKYNIETLKDNPTVRAYRDFYWKLHRPDKNEALRRSLAQKSSTRKRASLHIHGC